MATPKTPPSSRIALFTLDATPASRVGRVYYPRRPSRPRGPLNKHDAAGRRAPLPTRAPAQRRTAVARPFCASESPLTGRDGRRLAEAVRSQTLSRELVGQAEAGEEVGGAKRRDVGDLRVSQSQDVEGDWEVPVPVAVECVGAERQLTICARWDVAQSRGRPAGDQPGVGDRFAAARSPVQPTVSDELQRSAEKVMFEGEENGVGVAQLLLTA